MSEPKIRREAVLFTVTLKNSALRKSNVRHERQAEGAKRPSRRRSMVGSGDLIPPDIRVLLEIGPLRADDAKSLTRRRLHDPPSADFGNPLGTELLKSIGLRLDIVGLDVKVNSALVWHSLHEDFHFVRRTFERAVQLGRIRSALRSPTDGRSPEPGRCVDVLCPAIDDDVAEAALMHAGRPVRGAQRISSAAVQRSAGMPGVGHLGRLSTTGPLAASRCAGDPHEHSRTDFLAVMEGKHEVRHPCRSSVLCEPDCRS